MTGSAERAGGRSMASGPREWNAEVYHRVSDFQLELGLRVLERLDLKGDETVLDAGCGTGRVTRHLVDRLPQGRVIAVDASEAMVEKARELLPPSVTVAQADVADFALEEPVDAIISTAVFHWIPDHDRLFRSLYRALRPRGRLVAQCGGKGNVGSVLRAVSRVQDEPPFDAHLSGWRGPWHFASAEKTRDRLERAGFTDLDTWLEARPMVPEEPAEYLRTVTLGLHLERLPEELHEPFMAAVLSRLGDPPEIDYIRLNVDARRP